MIRRFWRKAVHLVQLIAVVLFIVFEELVWEGIAKPLYDRFASLRLLKRIENIVNRVAPAMILAFFILLLVSVEAVGLLAGALFVSGHFYLGAGLYVLKLPFAAFTFWLFKVSKPKLMRFAWFARLYEMTMVLIDRIKSWHVYRSFTARIRDIKYRTKATWHRIKARFIAGDNGVTARLKRLYRHIKATLKTNK